MEQVEHSYRDELSTVNQTGKRVWLYPKKFSGKWQNRRRAFGYLLFIFLMIAPFVKVKGHQMVLLNVLERKFIFFGSVFWPQDFYIFLLCILAIFVSIFLFTSILGRLWCGWACPQTIFMELIFRRIEYLFEGDASSQRKLSKMSWNETEKILKRGGKIVAFYFVSFLIANVFFAYIIGSQDLFELISEPISKTYKNLIALTVFTSVFFFVYIYMREQICTIVCPYGRLQSVLLDDKSLVVAYDNKRGEARAKWGKNRPQEAGDCIDCKHCVDVCPTGIDIRNGIQLECINCTACIDACDEIMVKIDKPTNLIGFKSIEGINTGKKFSFTPRRIIYSAVIVVLITAITIILYTRKDVQAIITRTPGLTFSEQNQNIRNIYNIKIINKTFDSFDVLLRPMNFNGSIGFIGNDGIKIPSESLGEGIIFVDVPKSEIKGSSVKLKIGVYQGDKLIYTAKTNFLTPLNN